MKNRILLAMLLLSSGALLVSTMSDSDPVVSTNSVSSIAAEVKGDNQESNDSKKDVNQSVKASPGNIIDVGDLPDGAKKTGSDSTSVVKVTTEEAPSENIIDVGDLPDGVKESNDSVSSPGWKQSSESFKAWASSWLKFFKDSVSGCKACSKCKKAVEMPTESSNAAKSSNS